jgi:sugar phosphate permease
VHHAWLVAGVTFVALLTAAGFRATPGVLMVPLQEEFGWTSATISLAASVNLVLFGLIAPFAAALMERLGIRRVMVGALILIAAGSGLAVAMRQSWQLVLLWGVLVGSGAGAMALVLAATVAGRWFVKHRGLVTGILTASSATGQLVFLPVLALLTERNGWRAASVTVAVAALAVVPLVVAWMRNRPEDVGLRPYGVDGVDATDGADGPAGAGARGVGAPASAPASAPAAGAIAALKDGLRSRAFWLLGGSFLVCGATTVGIIGTHFIPAAHDHGMPQTTAASLLALVGIFDIVGSIASGWLTDRVSSVRLLVWYYGLRGLALMLLPGLLGPAIEPTLFVFVVFYGLDWVATVPPTIALCRQWFGQERAGVMFGWVFAAHQLGGAVAVAAAGSVRTALGDYGLTWLGAGLLCWAAVVMVIALGRGPRPRAGVPGPAPRPQPEAAG